MLELATGHNDFEQKPKIPKDRAIKLGKVPIDVVAIHGAWHDESTWDPVKQLLKSEGINVITPRLAISSSFRSFDDHAKSIARQVRREGSKRVVLVGHSRGWDKALRVPQFLDPSIEVEGLVDVAGSTHTASMVGVIPIDKIQETRDVPRNTPEFIQGQIPLKNMKSFVRREHGDYVGFDTDTLIKRPGPDGRLIEQKLAKYVFYNTTPEEEAEEAFGTFRIQFRSKVEPIMTYWPQTDVTVVKTNLDNCVTKERQEHVISVIKPNTVYELDTDHSPQRSASAELAGIIYERVRAVY